METLLVKPRSARQLAFVETMLEYGRVRFERMEERPQGADVPEGDRYWPVLDEKIREALQEEREGRAVELKETDSAEDFWRQVREYEI